MIARAWHGVTPAAKADDYLEYLKRPAFRNIKRPMETMECMSCGESKTTARIFSCSLSGIHLMQSRDSQAKISKRQSIILKTKSFCSSLNIMLLITRSYSNHKHVE